MPSLIINGDPRTFPDGLPESLLHLIHTLALPPEALVAEVDGAVVRARDFASTPLQDGSVVELVQLVGGG